jgi:signal recognition particle subunit SRP54
MLETLTRGFRNARNRLAGVAEIDEKVVDEAVRDIRVSLLEADVEFGVVKKFIGRVREKALGEVVQTRIKHGEKKMRVSASDHFISICQKELEEMMGPVETGLAVAAKGTPTGVMLAGLQGSGKTTTAAKLASLLTKQGRRPLLVAADIYRPAAVEQLHVVGEQVGVPVYSEQGEKEPVLICERAMFKARRDGLDTVIFDTAGRLAIDEPLMQELENIKKRVKPKNILLVVDAMIGQDSVNTAREFHRRLGLSGVILTKLDGDARGGAAISVKEVTGAPIKYLGMGEGLDKLEEFRPEGLASRILGFGDVVGLVQDFEKVTDMKKAEEDAMRLLKGQFSLIDFLEQIKILKKMGSLQDVVEKMPFFPDGLPEDVNLDEREVYKIESIIHSMTRTEKIDPALFDRQPKRIARVARGSGRDEKEVKELLKRFNWMKKMMGDISSQAGLLAKIPGMKQLAMARKLKDAVKMGGPGAGVMNQLAGEMLETAVASMRTTKLQRTGSRVKKKAKRKQERKARKKARKKKR